MELIAQSLACRRAGRLVFADISFRVAPGEAALLRGPNGSGKSSLLRMLAGLLPLEAGEVTLGGVSLRTDRDAVQDCLVYAGHLDAVKPQLTVRENLALWARLYGASLALPASDGRASEETGEAAPARRRMLDDEDEPSDVAVSVPADRIDAALERLGIFRLAHFPAGYCSAGQKRRLGLARLLVTDRPVWLLDEPTVSLDVEAVEIFGTLVRDHLAGGGFAIAATHVPLGLEHAQEIVMGQAVAEGEGATLLVDDPFLEGDWA